MSSNETLSILSEFKSIYSTWAAILILEMALLTGATGQIRVRTETIHSDEDRRFLKNPNVILQPSGGGHPDVDRIRASHFKDLNIISIFLIITPIWFTTLPSHFTVTVIMSVFSICKILETIISMEFVRAPRISTALLSLCYIIVVYIVVVCVWFYSY